LLRKIPFEYTLGGNWSVSEALHGEDGLANALAWHFAGMWLLFAGLAVSLLWGILSGHFRRDWFPIRPRELVRTVQQALTFRLEHNLGEYNAVQKLLYLGVMLAMVVMVLSGLAIWKPVQLAWLTSLFGGYETARVVHFLFMCAIVLFLVVHLTLVALVPRTLVAMVLGRAAHTARETAP
jgi:thiosulfate reductase cytochrome b subunit